MSLRARIIQNAVSGLPAALPDNLLVDLADDLLDAIETKVAGSETPVDDAVVMPIVRLVRDAFRIPDGDD
jgi:hypothetical protein